MKIRSAFAVAMLPLLGVALWSQQSVQYGVSVYGSLPVGDLNKDLDGKMGAGLSFIVPMEIAPGQVLRPRIDFTSYSIKDNKRYSDDYRESITFNAFGMGADYLVYPSGTPNRGVYLGVGVGFQRWGLTHTTYYDYSHHHYSDTSSETTYNRTSPSFSACLGVQANRWFAVEARFTTAQYYGNEGVLLGSEVVGSREISRNGSAVNIGVTCKW